MPAKSLQLCSTLCSPMDCIPPSSSVHGILTGMGCHAFLQGIFPKPKVARLLQYFVVTELGVGGGGEGGYCYQQDE